MSKPEDVTQEAMNVAASIEKDIPSRITGANRVFIRAVIARAITAAKAEEREACAATVEKLIRYREIFETEDESGIKWQNGGEPIMVDPELCAAAIRNRP